MYSNSVIGVSFKAWYIELSVSIHTLPHFPSYMSLFKLISALFVLLIDSFISSKYSSIELSIVTSSSIVSISTIPSWTFMAHIFAKQVAPNFEKLNLPTFESFC